MVCRGCLAQKQYKRSPFNSQALAQFDRRVLRLLYRRGASSSQPLNTFLRAVDVWVSESTVPANGCSSSAIETAREPTFRAYRAA